MCTVPMTMSTLGLSIVGKGTSNIRLLMYLQTMTLTVIIFMTSQRLHNRVIE